MQNQKYIFSTIIISAVFLVFPPNKVSAEIINPSPVVIPTEIVSSIKFIPAKYDIGIKMIEKSTQEIKNIIKNNTYLRDDEDGVSNFYLKGDDANRLPNISKLLKSYPHLQINDVNAKGDFVGCISKSDYDIKRAFASIKGRLYVIGSVAGIYACATGINDNGEVVGYYEYKEGMSRGFLWKKSRLTKLPLLKANERAQPERINNKGVIVGMASVGRPDGISEEAHAVRWVGGKIKDLGVPEGSGVKYCGWAFDVNNYGQILVDCAGKPALWFQDKMYYFDDLVSGLEESERFDTFTENEFNRNFSADNSLIFAVVKCSYKPNKFNDGEWVYGCDYRNMNVSVPKVINILPEVMEVVTKSIP